MKRRRDRPRAVLAPITLTVGVLLGLGNVFPAVRAQEPPKRIEIVAKDYSFTVASGYSIVGDPTEIVLRNEDTVAHGFNFSLFEEVRVEIEGGGYFAEGKGPNVYRVDPGETLVLKLTWVSRARPVSMKYEFWCDLHTDMQGEMLVVEVRRED